MYEHLSSEYPEDNFVFGDFMESGERTIIEVIANETIAFRQIISPEFDLEKNQLRVQGSYERNLRAYEKLSEEYMTKNGQEITYIDQAEVISIKTVKKIEV